MGKKEKHSGKNEVGYGNPPKHFQFKKGKSGNPKGRPKRSASLPDIVRKVGSKKINATANGQVETMTADEGVISKLYSRAVQGDVQAAKEIVKLKQATDQTVMADPEKAFGPEDQNVLREMVDWKAMAQVMKEEKEDSETH